jgi:major intracellular serine protease
MNNNCTLLPYISEPLFGFNRNAGQIYGWELQKFNIPAEWKNSKGEGVRVAVIDTGCDIYHPDLSNNIESYHNIIDPGQKPIDDNGHGTHVCGTIAAQDNKLGMVGIAPKARLIPFKVLDANGSGLNENVAKAVRLASELGCDFITMSLGSPTNNPALKKAVKYATEKGSIIFCAAGNAGWNQDIMYPAQYLETIAIGSVNQNLELSKFSCTGNGLDFLSPGENILSCMPNNGYSLMSGTSMSNPFAVGCAALLLSWAKRVGVSYKLKTKQDYINVFKDWTIKPKKTNKKIGHGIIQPVVSKVMESFK